MVDIGLIKNNAMVASQIAIALSQLKVLPPAGVKAAARRAPRVVLCGGMAVDIIGKPMELAKDNSNIGNIEVVCGGCARNTMECLNRLGVEDTLLISSVGCDAYGRLLLERLREHKQRIDGIYRDRENHTAIYMCMVQDQDQMTGVSDMRILECIPSSHLAKFASTLAAADILVLDANLSPEALDYVCSATSSRAFSKWPHFL